MNRDVRRFPDGTDAAVACGQQILAWLDRAVQAQGRAAIAISGGSSPRKMFEYFARTPFNWTSVQVFWVDERCVPADDAQSNFKLAQDTWLGPVSFPGSNVHRVQTEWEPAVAAEKYGQEIREYFGQAAGGLPAFDVIHRGMGPDAHTASLFPGEPLIQNRTDIAAAVWVEKFKQWRVTLLPGVLQAGRNTAMLVTGEDKVAALRSVLGAPFNPSQYPAQIASAGHTVWFVDAAASPENSD